MAQCTAPVNGHRSAAAQAACPACGGRSRSFSYSYPSYSSRTSFSTYENKYKKRAQWASAGSSVVYTPEQLRTLTPVREKVIERSQLPDLRDIFLCHAWDYRKNAAKSLSDLLDQKGVSVWFSEKDVLLGAPLLREIDRGLSRSRVGIVLVTPFFLNRIKNGGVADKELSALLSRDLLIPILHNTTFEQLREISPLLGSRSGLSTEDDSMEEIAEKLSELVNVEQD